MWLRNISQHTIHMSITGGKYGKSSYTGPVHLYGVYRDCRRWVIVHPLNGLNQNNSRGAKIGARIKLQKRICGGTEFVHTTIFK